MNTPNDFMIEMGRLFGRGRGGKMNALENQQLDQDRTSIAQQAALRDQVYNYYLQNNQSQPPIMAAREGEQQLDQRNQMMPGVLEGQHAANDQTRAQTGGIDVNTEMQRYGIGRQKAVNESVAGGRDVRRANTEDTASEFGLGQAQKKAAGSDKAAGYVAGHGVGQSLANLQQGGPDIPPELLQSPEVLNSGVEVSNVGAQQKAVEESKRQGNIRGMNEALPNMYANPGAQNATIQALMQQLGIPQTASAANTNEPGGAAVAVQAMRQRGQAPGGGVADRVTQWLKGSQGPQATTTPAEPPGFWDKMGSAAGKVATRGVEQAGESAIKGGMKAYDTAKDPASALLQILMGPQGATNSAQMLKEFLTRSRAPQ